MWVSNAFIQIQLNELLCNDAKGHTCKEVFMMCSELILRT